MAIQTHLDEIINYKSNVIIDLCNSPLVVGLMLDKTNPDVNGDDGDDARSRMYDFDYITETNLQAEAYILVDADVVSAPTWTVKNMELYVQIVLNKSYMKLDNKRWKGRKGNRLDNLVREIDILLNGSRDYGIGKLQLVSARTANVPAAFTSKLLVYQVPDFARDRQVGLK